MSDPRERAAAVKIALRALLMAFAPCDAPRVAHGQLWPCDAHLAAAFVALGARVEVAPMIADEIHRIAADTGAAAQQAAALWDAATALHDLTDAERARVLHFSARGELIPLPEVDDIEGGVN